MPRGYMRAEIDSNVTQYLQQFSTGLDSAIDFGMRQAKLFLRNEGLPTAVEIMSAKAGEGFPRSYKNHLREAVGQLPIIIIKLSVGAYEVGISLERLGDYEDLLRGAHQNAMLASNDDGEFKSFRKTTKGLLRKAVLGNLYSENDLLNSRERRVEWWNAAIGSPSADTKTMVGKNWKWAKPATRTADDAWDAESVPTFEQVASDRVNDAWIPRGVAPEWILLEFGSSPGTFPVVYPQNFQENLRQLVGCACNEAVYEAVKAFEILLAERQVVGIKGPQASPYNALGQFVQYKDLLAKSVPNLSNCLALI